MAHHREVIPGSWLINLGKVIPGTWLITGSSFQVHGSSTWGRSFLVHGSSTWGRSFQVHGSSTWGRPRPFQVQHNWRILLLLDVLAFLRHTFLIKILCKYLRFRPVPLPAAQHSETRSKRELPTLRNGSSP
jgi:hypothetical protein